MRNRLVRRGVAGLLSLFVVFFAMGSAHAVGPATAPAAPGQLSMQLNGKAVSAGGWIASTEISLRFAVTVTNGPLTPEVEIEPSTRSFSNEANYSGSTLSTSGEATVLVDGLSNAMTYHWQARVVDAANDASPWVSFASMPSTLPDFGIDMTPPTRPIIRSATNPNQSLWYNNSVAQLQWASRDHISGIAGYTYVLERHAHVIPPGNVVDSTAMTIRNLSDGIWILALRSVDRAGNWSPTATYRLQIDRHPVQVRWLTPQRITLNPYQGPQTVRFSVSKDAQVHVGLYRVGSRVPTQTLWYPHVGAGQVITITVTGKGPKGNPYPKGYYFFSIEAIDHANNITRTNLGGIDVRPEKPSVSATGQQLFDDGGKQIIVSLSRETLYAYDGTKLVLQTLVTTGNPNLPTPTGHFTVLAKYHPYEFISPWPQGSPYWYPPSWSQYAMLFRDGGYFLHDAPWRSAFGPGTNGPGQPGTNFGGTHGCVNIPPGPTLFLYNWAAIGTPVNVVP